MKPCFKILGRGAQGITYLTPENIVVKVEAVRKNLLNDGDRFGLEIVPKLPKEIKKHFVQYYSVEFYTENPLENLKCKTDNSIFRFFKKSSFESLKFPKLISRTLFFKVTTMENAGHMFAQKVLTSAKMLREYFEQLYVPVCAMNYMGYFHKDLHTQNVMFDGKTFKLIDYGLMKKYTQPGSGDDIYRLIGQLEQYRTSAFIKSKYELYDDFENIFDMDRTCIKKIKVPEKYKDVAYDYRVLFHPLEVAKCDYLNDDIEIVYKNKDKIYEDDTLLELIKIIYNTEDYQEMAVQITNLINKI